MHFNLLNSFYLFMTALFMSLLIVPRLRNWSLQKGLLDQPDQRKIHSTPIPRLGGIGIFIAFLFAILIHAENLEELRAVLVGALVIFTTGLLDDFQNLSAKKKFLGQIAACTVTIVLGDLYITNLGNLFGFGQISLPVWLAIPFTVFAVVGVINAINFIDGLDGLAGGISLISVSVFLLLSIQTGNTNAALLCSALTGALLGFLKHNSYPANIFMGDAGSMTLGFLLGFLAVMLTQKGHSEIQPIIPVIILGVPILDNIWVMSHRALKGQSPFHPDRSHVHHQFLDLGFHHRFTVISIYMFCCFWALIAALAQRQPAYVLFYGYLLINLSLYFLLRYLAKNKDLFSFFNKDSEKSLRDSVFFKRFRKKVDHSFLFLAILLSLELLLTAVHSVSAVGATRYFAALIFIGGILTLIFKRRIDHNLPLLFLYFATLLIIFQSMQNPSYAITKFFTNEHLAAACFTTLVILTLLKMILLTPEEFKLSPPLDFLILCLSISLVVVSFNQAIYIYIEQTIAKIMVYFLAIKQIHNIGGWALNLLFAAGMCSVALLIFASR